MTIYQIVDSSNDPYLVGYDANWFSSEETEESWLTQDLRVRPVEVDSLTPEQLLLARKAGALL